MRLAGHIAHMGEEETCIQVLAWKPWGKKATWKT